MVQPVRFAYTSLDNPQVSLMPRLPLTLSYANRFVDVLGLLDTGASVNVLPYPIGLALGAVWEQQRVNIPLVGSLGRFEARALLILASHPQLTPDEPVRLVFAWTRADDAPIIFGQTNFFSEFNVCFYAAQLSFEIQPKHA